MTRRDFVRHLATAVAATSAATLDAAPPAQAQVEVGSTGVWQRLPLGTIRPRGWMRAQMQRDLELGLAGHLDTLSSHVANDLYAQRLQAADGQLAWWDAESRGHWLWGYTMLAHLAGVPAHRERADALVRSLRATQDADGYLGIHAPAVRYRTGDVENGELWAQSRALLVLLAHHELTGDPASLEAARRAADLTLAHYVDRSPFGTTSTTQDRTGVTHGLCYVDALQWLHELTADPRYAAGAQRLLGAFDAWPRPFPNDDFAAASLADPLRGLHGHAVHTVEHLRAVACGSPDTARLQAALRKLRYSTTPSGAVIGDESIHGVPQPLSGYEYCVLAELVFGLGRSAQVLHDAALGDWLERVAFNAAQGARMADGRAMSYLSSDTRLDATAHRPDTYSLLNGKHGRYKLSPTHDDIACCCAPNSVRLLPHYVSMSWLRTPDGLAALAYGPSELRTQVGRATIRIEQDTRYPFEDEIRYTVETSTPASLELRLRRPEWARAWQLAGVDGVERDGWIVIARQWRGRLEFKLRFEVPVRAEPYADGEAAVLRGPLQFVQALPYRVQPRPVTTRPQWPDAELYPADEGAAETLPLFDTTRADLGLDAQAVATNSPDLPWDVAPLILRNDQVTLVPMGSAPLRRAAFRLRVTQREGSDSA